MSFVECSCCGKSASKKCGRCSQTTYCSKKCQEMHWNISHQYQCIGEGPFDIFAQSTMVDRSLFWKMADNMTTAMLARAIAYAEESAQDKVIRYILDEGPQKIGMLKTIFTFACTNSFPEYERLAEKLFPNFNIKDVYDEENFEVMGPNETFIQVSILNTLSGNGTLKILKMLYTYYENGERHDLHPFDLVDTAIKKNRPLDILNFVTEQREFFFKLNKLENDIESAKESYGPEKHKARIMDYLLSNPNTKYIQTKLFYVLEYLLIKFDGAKICETLFQLIPDIDDYMYFHRTNFLINIIMSKKLKSLEMCLSNPRIDPNKGGVVAPVLYAILEYTKNNIEAEALELLFNHKKIDLSIISAKILSAKTFNRMWDLQRPDNKKENNTFNQQDIEDSVLYFWSPKMLKLFLLGGKGKYHKSITGTFMRGIRDNIKNKTSMRVKEKEDIISAFIKYRETADLS